MRGSWMGLGLVISLLNGGAMAQETSTASPPATQGTDAGKPEALPTGEHQAAQPESAAPPAAAPVVAAPPAEPSEEELAAEALQKARDEMEEIVVTATKTETKLQETPVAVTAMPGESLKRQQVSDLKSVTALVPNLQIGAHSDSAAVDVSLRGIVSTNRTELGDPAVAFHVDGFYSPRPQGATTLLYDVDRIEILRGPQGTLFGRNANAGVINVITTRPVFRRTSLSVDLTAGDHSLLRIQNHLNIPLLDKLSVRAASYIERRDGFTAFQRGSLVPPGSARYDNSDKSSLRLSALWEPTQSVSVFLSGEYFSDQGAGTVPVRIVPLAGTPLRSALIDSPGVLDLVNATLHGRVDYRPMEWLELSYLGGYGRMTRRNVSDNDVGFKQEDRFQQEHRTHDSTFVSQSHELQAKSRKLAYVDFIAGGFFYKESNDIRFDIDINDDPDHDGIHDQYWAMSFVQPDRELTSLAGFAQATGHLTRWLRLTGGARVTTDNKSDVGGRNLVCNNFGAQFGQGGVNLKDLDHLPLAGDLFGPTPHPDGTCGSFPGNAGNDVDKTWNKVTWMGRLESDLAQGLLLYALVSTGFKSGVIQDGGSTADPEEVVNYELGVKTRLLDGALDWNTVGFYSDYHDILRSRAEEQADGSQQMVTRNATAAFILGVESEARWFVTPLDRLQLMLSYLKAEYQDFPSIDNVLYATADPLSPTTNLKGNKLPFSPAFTVAAAYEHYFDFAGGWSIVPRLQTQFQTEMYLGDFNRSVERQGSFTRTDLSVRYETRTGWLVELFARNLEDRAVKSNVEIKGNEPGAGGVAGNPGIAYAYYDAPRTFGLRVAYTFGK